MEDALLRDSLRQQFLMAKSSGEGEDAAVEKLKRRKLTPLNAALISNRERREQQRGWTASSAAAPIDPSAMQSIDNVSPNLPSFSEFPFTQIESVLQYQFKDRRLLFQAFTHSSAVDGVHATCDNQVLEWIGDAALDWAVCRYYWYGLRDSEPESMSVKGAAANFNVNANAIVIVNDTDCSSSIHLGNSSSRSSLRPFLAVLVPSTCGSDFTRVHPAPGALPLSPDKLTRARQSITNNEALARIAVQFGFHRWMRVNSAHLQREIEKFSNGVQGADSQLHVGGKK